MYLNEIVASFRTKPKKEKKNQVLGNHCKSDPQDNSNQSIILFGISDNYHKNIAQTIS
jgi:hypothetical protein